MRLVCCVAAAMLFAAGGSAEAAAVQANRAGAHSDDHVSVQSATSGSMIPEPSGVALLGASLLGFAGVIRRHRAGSAMQE